MNTYRVSIGRYSKKMVFELLNEIFITSKNSEADIVSAYSDKYKGFQVVVKKIEDIGVFETEMADGKKAKEIKSTIVPEESLYSSFKYRARIKNSDIPEYKKYRSKIDEAEKARAAATAEMKEYIEKTFGLTSVDDFRVTYETVDFTFTPSGFKFINEPEKKVPFTCDQKEL